MSSCCRGDEYRKIGCDLVLVTRRAFDLYFTNSDSGSPSIKRKSGHKVIPNHYKNRGAF